MSSTAALDERDAAPATRSLIAKVEPMTTARALRGPFDYRLPEALRGEVGVGSMLVVPFGARKVLGVVVALADSSEVAEEKLLAPLRALDEGPPAVPVELLALAEWIAAEYCSTIARALALVLPPGATRRLSGRKRRAVARPEHLPVGARGRGAPELTLEQQAVLAPVYAALRERRGEQRLLHGVTGSGKTEIYLCAAHAALAQGRGAIVLVPEIALTPQIVGRFVERFGDTVAVLHSRLTPAQRYAEWRRLRDGEARVCVGPRSAVFAPIEELGLIVVDEEHDASYKHEGDPRYDARDVAAERAVRSGAVLLAGSATPRPESVQRLPVSVLASRVDGRPLPAVRVLDMRGEAPGLHPLTAQALGDVRAARRQGDRPAQPARLVELPLVSLVRARVELPGLRRGARAAPRRRLPRVPSLRSPRARTGALLRLLLDGRRAPRRRHRAPAARPRPRLRRRSLPGVSPRRRRGRGGPRRR